MKWRQHEELAARSAWGRGWLSRLVAHACGVGDAGDANLLESAGRETGKDSDCADSIPSFCSPCGLVISESFNATVI